MRKFCFSVLAALALALPSPAQERVLEEYLERGDLAAGQTAVETALKTQPDSNELQLQLALAQLFRGVERYSQEMHRLALRDSVLMGMVPFLRFPVPANDQPAQATNAEVRAAIERLASDLGEVPQTLSKVPDSWKGTVPLKLGRVRMDFNGDGTVAPDEELWRVVEGIDRSMTVDVETAEKFGVHLDAGDVRWLEGYCHVLMGLADTGLAYDTERLFDHTAHLFFTNPKSSYPFLTLNESEFFPVIADVAALLHLLDLPLLDGPRLGSALDHFRQVAPLSRRSWANIGAETDNSFEWIPNPKQTSVAGWKVTPEMITEWYAFLGEAEAVLEGKRLLPFWRPDPETRGLNLNKVFSQPRDMDAILWAQGTAAVPYLEKGEVLSPEIWRRLNSVFDGQFFGFAVWFN